MRMSGLLKLYPPAWRARYGDEMAALVEERPPTARERFDLARGALDAWLHPPTPSVVPIVAALVGGGLWTIVASAVLVQPVPLDWPGYLMEALPLATVAAGCLFVAALGCALRAGEARSRAAAFGIGLLLVGYVAWIAMLAGTVLGAVGGSLLGASQSIAMLGTLAIGLLLVRARDQPIGWLLLVSPIALLVPSTVMWLGFGMAWTAVGVAMWLDRQERTGSPLVGA
jgi:hypothetical protein